MTDNGNPRPLWFSLAVWAALALLLVIVGVSVAGGYFHEFNAGEWIRQIEEMIAAWGPWGAAVSMAIMALHSFIPFPAEFLAIANGMVFGPVMGTVVTWSGAMIGALLAFGLSRLLGRPFVEMMLSRRQGALLDQWTGEGAVKWIFLARFIPVIAFNLINYAAGLTRVTWWTFTWTTAIGILPMTVLMVVMGSAVHHLAWHWWLVLMAGGILIWVIFRRWLIKSQ